MQISPIRGFGLRALLWLPLSFFLWFAFASPLVWPVVRLAKLALLSLWPELFSDVVQLGHSMDVTTRVLVNQITETGVSGIGELILPQNPLIYGYSLPLFSGLVMATPMRARWRLLQLALAFVAIWAAQAFGVVSGCLKMLAFESGGAGAAAIGRTALSPDAIALAYQFGYLILPAVLPVALWLSFNRHFIDTLVHPTAEPDSTRPGHTGDALE